MLSLITTGALALLVVCICYFQFFARGLPLPPGPPGELIGGNVKQLIGSPWLVYAKWAELYGPIISYRIFNKRVIVLNSGKAVNDLLESRASIYSDRPMQWMSQGLTGRWKNVFFIPALNPRHKKYRRHLHSGLSTRAINTYMPVIEQESRMLLASLATTPDDLHEHIRRNVGAIILKIAYGWQVTGNDDEFTKIMVEAVEIGEHISKPGRWLVDFIPWLRYIPAWVPGAGFKRVAAYYKKRLSRIDEVPFAWTKEQIKSGNYVESFTSMGLLNEKGEPLQPEEEDILKWSAAALFAGGADTSASVLKTFFLMMVLHPDIQKRAQAEIDQLLHNARLPTIEDQKDLPYTEALIKEVLRYAPVAPLGIPHRVTQEDTYNEYRIPKGTAIVSNIWAITHDSDMYPNPFTFDPDRFIARSGSEPQIDPRKWIFGFGRRVCPGAQFAETTVFINIASILSTFDISKALDASGREIMPEVVYTIGITSHPKPFACRIIPRSPELLAPLGVAVA